MLQVTIKKKLGNFLLDVDFCMDGGVFAILGASGCGKSMTLKCIAGIERPDEGRIVLNDRVLFDSKKKINLPPQKRKVGYMFQDYALFPNMNVVQNIQAGMGRKPDQKKVQEYITGFHLTGLEKHMPDQLSGGQKQRVAMARMLAAEPELLLLDEPFAALDSYLKWKMEQQMMDLLKDIQKPALFVSHSRDEIYRFSEELLIMDQGKPVIYGETKKIFAKPVYKEAAKLTGCKNFSRIKRVDAHTAEILDWGITLHTNQEIDEQAVWLGYRAHDFVPVWGKRKENCLKINVESEAALPFERNYYLYPEGEENQDKQTICWFLQREKLEKIGEKGMPDYLELTEEGMMFLRG